MSAKPAIPQKKGQSNKGLGDLYRPTSRAKSLNVDVPDSMTYEIHEALTKVQAVVGSFDDFVQKKLKYGSKEDLYNALSAEQIDAVALAIYNIEYKNQAIIIGDQTGIGKGRIAASMMRYGIVNNQVPVFITEKPNLFSDLYRDLKAIGASRYKPFIVNAKDSKSLVKDEDGNIVFEPLDADRQKKIIASNTLPREFDYVMLTYSQISDAEYDIKGNYKGTSPKIGFVRAVVENGILIMDESHNASGSSNTGRTLKSIVKAANGVTFLSATFAKRPDNMAIYATKTAISEANLDSDGMTAAMNKGGVALQEVVSAQLVGQAQMIRRERSFEGIEVNYLTDETNAKSQREISDNVTEIMRLIVEFQEKYITPEIKRLDKINAARQGSAELRKGTEKGGVDNTPYFSKIFQAINQMLFAIKAQSVVERSLVRLKQGKKVVIAFSSTMGAFIESLTDIEGNPVGDGDRIPADFATVLLRGLQGVLRYTVKDYKGNTTYEIFDISEFSPEAQQFYRFVESKIKKSSVGIVISPIDQIKQSLEANGYRVAEVTGRKYEVVLDRQGLSGAKPLMPTPTKIFGTIKNRKRENTNDAFRRFNDNEVDVLMINQSGSTGASAHAIPTKKVPASQVKQRVMIVLQAELDINTEVQKRGRINRTGQIIKPIYDYVTCAVPAEKRLMMMLQKKLKSLDANTTSNQKNSEAILKSNDFLNKYGDRVVVDYLKENKKFNTAIGNPLKIGESDDINTEDAAHKVSGRVAILPTKNQEEFYDEITERYQRYVALLVEQGDYDLEVETQDLKAKTLDRSILVANANTGKSPFSDHTYLEKCEINTLKKPYTVGELEKRIADVLTVKGQQRTPEEYSNELVYLAKNAIEKRLAERKIEIEAEYKEIEKGVTSEKEYLKLKSNEDKSEYKAKRKKEISVALYEENLSEINKYENQFKMLGNYFRFFVPSKNLTLKDDIESESSGESMAVSLGFRFGNNKKNAFAPSNISLVVAVAGSKKQLTIPLAGKTLSIVNSLKGTSESYVLPKKELFELWKSAIQNASKDRTNRYIATGNLLQFFGQDEVPKSKLIQFTTIEGKIRKGALLPESFDPKGDRKNGVMVEQKILVPVNKCVPIITRLSSSQGIECTSNLTIGYDYYRGIKFIVPASRQSGGHIFLNEQVLRFVKGGNFISVSSKMVAFVDNENLQKLLDVLANELKVSATLSQDQFKTIEGEFKVNQNLNDELRPIERKTRPEPTPVAPSNDEAERLRKLKLQIAILKLKAAAAKI